jgi:hypothetical protein
MRKFLPSLIGSRCCAWRRQVHRRLRGGYGFCWWINMLVGRWRSECSYNSQITENAVPLEVDTPLTTRWGSDIPFEAVLQNIYHFRMTIFFQFFHSGVTVVNFVNHRRNKLQKLKWGEQTGQIPLLIILSPKTLDKACINIWYVQCGQ